MTIKGYRSCHNVLSLSALAIACLAASTLPTLSTSWQIGLLVLGVVTVGMPHGAMDHRVGEFALRPRFGQAWRLVFGAGYLGMIALVLLSWSVLPAATLVAFLLYSSLHFGLGDEESERGSRVSLISVLSRGSLPILLPVVFHPTRTGELLGWVANRDIDLSYAHTFLTFILIVATGGTLLRTVVLRQWRTSLEVGLLVVLNAVSAPLLAFGTYFVLVHSTRHVLDLAEWLEPGDPGAGLRRVAVECLPLTGITLALMTLAWLLRRSTSAEAASMRVLFVTLSALTVPHMLITMAGKAEHFRQVQRGPRSIGPT